VTATSRTWRLGADPPDGYIGAIVSSDERPALTAILSMLGSQRPLIERRNDRC